MILAAVPRVEISSLSLGAELGAGGQGRVVGVSGSLIDGRWPAVLKIYSQAALADLDVAVLETIAGLPVHLGADQACWLLEDAAWPAAIAEDRGMACGFLMRAVPAEYYFSFQTQTQGARRKLADVAFLLNPDHYVSKSGLAVSEQDRLALLGSLARLLTRWHKLGIAIGDLSPKNLLFSIVPSPNCFVIDCDAVRLRGSTVLSQVETPDWEAPSGEPKATAATDSYKFGLLAIRLFARDQSSRDRAAITALSPELGLLAQLSQQPDPARRPGPGAWIGTLDAVRIAASNSKFMPRPAVPAGRISVPIPPVPAIVRPGTSPAALPVRSRSRRLTAAAAAALIAITVTVIGIADLKSGSHPPSPGTAGPAPAADQQVTRRIGIVHVRRRIANNQQATAVAEIFNTYFSSINRHAYRRALSVFDPSGQIDPHDPAALRAFSSGVSTTRDSDVVLARIKPDNGTLASRAEVRFRSRQAAGYGPGDIPDARCVRWNITYELTRTPAGQYRIYRVQKEHDSRC
jgi:eukaryotic-like serine/threonine-protein kinase